MKKMLCVMLALIMCTSLFAACGGEKEMTENQDLENGALSNDEQDDQDAVTDQNQNLEDDTETDMEQNNAVENDSLKDEKQNATIIWKRNARIENGEVEFYAPNQKPEEEIFYNDEVPEDFLDFIYNYKKMDEYYLYLIIDIYPESQITLEDMSDEYQEKYREYKEKYGTFTGKFFSTDDPERSEAYSLICSMAQKEINEKFDVFYRNLEFTSSVKETGMGGYIEYGEDLSYGYYIAYSFSDIDHPSNLLGVYERVLEDFFHWEWNDINKLAKLDWINKICVSFNVYSTDCT